MEPLNGMRKTYRVATIIAAAMIASLFLYLVLVEVMKSRVGPFLGQPSGRSILTIRYVFYALAILQVIIIRLLQGMILKKSPSDGQDVLTRKLFTVTIITLALSEVPAILGLVLFLLTGLSRDFYVLVFVSLVLMFMFFPRYQSWKNWISG